MGKGEKQFAAISKAGRRLAGSIGAPISPAHFPLWLLAKRYPATGALSITMLTGICLMIWVLIPRYCRKLHYRLEEEGITITRGLFFARMIRLPRPESLYTCVYRTPFYRMAGLYGVALWGAGMHMLLPGMTQAQAQAVLSLLTRVGKEGSL